jgi:hypothetical protein
MNPQRKVGQDMIRKKSSSQMGNVVVSVKPVVQKQPVIEIPRKTYVEPIRHQADLPVRMSSNQSTQPRPPAKGGLLWVLVGVAIIVLIFTLFSLAASASLTLTLKRSAITVTDQVINLSQEPAPDQVGYKTATITDRQSIIIPGQVQKPVSINATGTVKLFSTSSTKTSIPANTILTATNGKTFVLKKSVTLLAGSTEKPSSIETSIVATAPGTEYNIGRDDLKISAYPAIVARTTTDITGGFNGNQFSATESEIKSAEATLQERVLSSKPAVFLSKQIPADFLIPDSFIQVSPITFTTQSVTSGVEVIAERSITGNMINKKQLSNYLVQHLISESDRTFMEVVDISNLTFVPVNLSDIGTTTTNILDIFMDFAMLCVFLL